MDRIKIVYQLTLFCLLLCVVPIVVITLALWDELEKSIRMEQATVYENEVDNYVLQLGNHLLEYSNMAGRIASDPSVYAFFGRLEDGSALDRYRAGAQLESVIDAQLSQKNDMALTDVNIFLDESLPETYAPRISTVSAARRDGWYAQYEELPDTAEGFLFLSGRPTGNRYCIIKRVYPYKQGPFGVSMGFVKFDLLVERLCNTSLWGAEQDKYSVLITSADNRDICYAKHAERFQQPPAAYARMLSENGGRPLYLEKNRLLVGREIARTGWNAYFIIHDGSILEKLGQIRAALILLGSALSALAVLLSATFSRRFSVRINRLISKMNQVKKGRLDILAADVIEGRDEVAELDRHFNDMVRMLKKLIDDNYVQTLATREAELNALKFQINPHFLFNTLETINAMSSELGVNQIGAISQKLGEMFRYGINVSGGELELLKNELRHVRNYIDIQKIRFDDRFDVRYQIPPELESCRVIRFVLQPLVENAVKYGAEQSDHCQIVISARREGGKLLLGVSDDGPGISPEQVAEMNRFFAEGGAMPARAGAGHGIGLKNVSIRVRMLHEAGSGLHIESEVGRGTRVTVCQPYYNDR